MAHILYVHWHEAEARERAKVLIKAGHKVQVHSSTTERLTFGEALPDAVVISLDRLPSHGRAIAEWCVETKKRQHIPLIFVGGAPEKVAATRAKFPNARYGPPEEALALVAKALVEGAAEPVRAGQTTARKPATVARKRRGEERG